MTQMLTGIVCALLAVSCSKKTNTLTDARLPEKITGTVKSLDISYIDMEPAIPNGIFEINGSDGRTYHFKFAKLDDLFANEVNCSMRLDTTMVLPPDAPFPDTTAAQLRFKKCYQPNSIAIQFFDNADAGDTHGVKTMTATFTADTEIWADFFDYVDRPVYAMNRTKAIDKINAIIHGIKDYYPAPGDQPAKIICQAYTY
jgi:hypothetical protein